MTVWAERAPWALPQLLMAHLGAKQYSGYHCLLGVCKACSGSGWAAITFPGILAVGKVSPGCIGYALCVRVNTWVMSNMLYLNAQGFKLFVTDI